MASADIKDFTVRYKGHPRYNSSQIIEDRPIEFIIQKIEMILYTNKGEILDDPDFGCNLEYYLWSTKVPVTKIQKDIQNQINEYIPELNTINYNLDVNVFEGTVRDILRININIQDTEINFVLK